MAHPGAPLLDFGVPDELLEEAVRRIQAEDTVADTALMQDVDLEVTERDHPAIVHLGPIWRWHDDVYQFCDLRADARVLLRHLTGGLEWALGPTR